MVVFPRWVGPALLLSASIDASTVTASRFRAEAALHPAAAMCRGAGAVSVGAGSRDRTPTTRKRRAARRPPSRADHPRSYAAAIGYAARRHGLPRALLFALVREESRFEAKAV